MRARRVGDAWFWIENNATSQQRLVRVQHGQETVLATADEIVGFDATSDEIAWTQRQGATWSVRVLPTTGSVRILAQSTHPIGSPCIGNRAVFWPSTVPGFAPSSPIPALQSTVHVMASAGAGPPEPIATLPVPKANIAGTDGADLYVVATEGTGIQTMAIYVVPIGGGPARRIVGDTSIYSTAVLPGRGVAWLGPSAECSDPSIAAEVHLADAKGVLQTLAVWLPAPGALFYADGKLWMVDATPTPKVWPADKGLELVHPIRLPADSQALAVGANEVLLQPAGAHGKASDVFVAPL